MSYSAPLKSLTVEPFPNRPDSQAPWPYSRKYEDIDILAPIQRIRENRHLGTPLMKI